MNTAPHEVPLDVDPCPYCDRRECDSVEAFGYRQRCQIAPAEIAELARETAAEDRYFGWTAGDEAYAAWVGK